MEWKGVNFKSLWGETENNKLRMGGEIRVEDEVRKPMQDIKF